MMDEMMKQLMAKKGASGKMSPEDMQAKMDVIKELLEMAQSAMAGKVKGGMDEMQKVSIMAPDQESLTEGLDAAKDIVGGDEDSDEMSEEASADEGLKLPDGESDEDMGMKKKKRPLFSMMDDEEDSY